MNEQTEQKGNERIEVMARLTDTKIEVNDIVSKWLLITYDIPHNAAGDRARRQFLMNARSIGATAHTDSVYLMPWTPTAEVLALELAKAGKVCVWTSQTTDTRQAKEITEQYDQSLEPMIDDIDERISKIEGHLVNNRIKRAEKMMAKTEKMLDGIEQAIIRRGNNNLMLLFKIVKRRYIQIRI